jgi:L,D-transpeptidase catalytic domain/Putative peptidoglycan binding domain
MLRGGWASGRRPPYYPPGMRRGIVVITLVLAALALPTPALASLSIGSAGPGVHQLQKKLIKLRYLGLTGVYGARTSQAVMAFQGWVGLTRDGVAGPTTLRRLHKADHRPIPWSRVYKHVEVHKARQVALLIGKGGKTVRAIHVSTAAPGHVTPSGHFRIFRKELMSWSKPFHVWLPYASYFYGGDAFHQYPSVPGYPASHGCIRIFDRDAIVMYHFATLGTRVVIA